MHTHTQTKHSVDYKYSETLFPGDYWEDLSDTDIQTLLSAVDITVKHTHKHTGCGLQVCPGSKAMSTVLSGRVMRNSSESTSVPSSSHTRDSSVEMSNVWAA